MANTGNMRRMQRGEISRLHPKMAARDQVYMGPPGGAKPTAAVAEKEDQTKIRELQLLLDNANETADRVTQELDKAKNDQAKLTKMVDELTKKLSDKPKPPVPVDNMKIVEVTKASIKDHVVSMVCTVEPTAGPLTESITITVNENELDKLFEAGDGKL